MRLRSSTMLISLGLACLTLSLVLMANSLGIGGGDAEALVRARVQTAQLVAAQCSPAAEAGDTATMIAILRQVASQNPETLSAGLRSADGTLIFEQGSHAKTWDASTDGPMSPSAKLRIPISTTKGDWGAVEFCYARSGAAAAVSFLPKYVNGVLINPSLRLAFFVGCTGFVCYLLYLRRTLRHLDPSAVVPPRVRAMLNALAEGVVILDGDGRIVMSNEAFARTTGISSEKLMGHRAEQFDWVTPENETPVTTMPWQRALATGQAEKGIPVVLRTIPTDASAQDATGASSAVPQRRVFMINAAPVLGPNGRARGALATFDDVTDVEKMNVELKRLATTDPLTGCLNRRSFLEQFDVHWTAIGKGEEKSIGCIMVDVDKFKSINDRFGHAAGDEVLKGVVKILRESLKDDGVAARYGGEEFCVMLPGKDLQGAADVAERVRLAIQNEPWTITNVTASLGVSASECSAASVKELLDQADAALYSSKRNGRNRVTRWGSIPAEGPAAEKPAGDGATVASICPSPSILSDPRTQASFASLTAALSHRHRETALHCKRVADYCMLAAPGLLKPDEASLLEAAAMLHDVGKLGIPDSVLLKQAPLTPEEWQVMRTHEQIGVDMIMASGMPQEIAWIASAHHAKFAATPGDDHPHSDQIPLAARLLAVADAFDAMTTDRPYRKRLSHEDAFAELRQCAGAQFDPEVVEHFINALTRASAAGQLGRNAA